MNRGVSRILIGRLGMVLIVGCASPEERAGKFLTEATQLVLSAQEAEQTSYSNAFELYQKALAKAETITAKYPSSQLAGKLVQGEVKIGSFTLTELKDRVVPRAQMKAEAEESPLACALLVARTIEETISRASVVAEIAVQYANAGQDEQILQIVKTTKDKESRSRILSEMISKYLSLGQYDQASRLANSVEDATLKDWALSSIARETAGKGPCEKALETATTLETTDAKTETLIHIANSCTQAGQNDEAIKILSQAFGIAMTIEDTSRKDWSLGQIAREYAEVGQYDQALEVTEKIVDSEEKTETLAEMVRQHTKAGHYDQAVKVALAIAGPSVQYRALAEITNACLEAGDKAKTRELLPQLLQAASAIEERLLSEGRMGRNFLRRLSPIETMQSHPIKARALAEVAGNYAKICEKEKATELLSRALTATNMVENADLKADALAEIAGGYAELGQFDDALQIAGTIQETYFKGRALAVIAAKYTQADQFDRAVQVAEAIEEPGSQSDALAAIAHRYVEVGQYDQALQLAGTMADDRLRRGVLADIADGYAKAGRQDEAADLFSQSKDGREVYWQSVEDERQATIAGMATMYAEAGFYDPALQIANLIKDASIKAGALTTVAHKFTEAGQKEKAAEILSQALEAAKIADERTAPDSSPLSGIAFEYTEIGKCDQAGEVAKVIRDASSKARTLSEIAIKCRGVGQREKATETSSQSLEMAKAIGDGAQEQAMADVAIQYADGGLYDQALRMMEMIVQDPSAKARAKREIYPKLADTGHCHLIPQVDDIRDVTVLAEIASRCAAAGAQEKAAESLSQALTVAKALEGTPDVTGNFIGTIAGKYAEVGYYDQAVELANLIQSSFYKGLTLTGISETCAKAGHSQKAGEILSQALAFANAMEGPSKEGLSKEGLLGIIASAYAKIGQPEQALQVANEAGNDLDKANVLSTITRQYAQAGQCDQSVQFAQTTLEAIRKSTEDTDLAMSDPFRSFAPPQTLVTKATLFADIAAICMEVEQKEKAAEIFSAALQAATAIQEPNTKANLLAGIARKYLGLGQYDQALRIANMIGDVSIKAVVLAEIARTYVEAGQYDQALQLASTIEDISAREKELFAIARKYAEEGAKEKATEISRQALQVANSMEGDPEDPWVKIGVLTQVADTYVEAGQYDQALVVANTMPDDTPKAGILAHVAVKYAQAGIQERAEAILTQALQIAGTRKEAEAKAQALMAVGFPYTAANLRVDDSAKKILHDMITELGESPWRESPSEVEEQKTRRRGWGMVGADMVP